MPKPTNTVKVDSPGYDLILSYFHDKDPVRAWGEDVPVLVVETLRLQDRKIAELEAHLAALSAPVDPTSFDPVALLTPDVVEGIKPSLKVLVDGLRTSPHVSFDDAVKARRLAVWLQMIYDAKQYVSPSSETEA